MNVKSLCMQNVTNLLKLNETNYIKYIINQEKHKEEVDKPLIPINFLDEYSLKSVGVI